ncbi:MAG TPA: phosphatidate cytidylyltransferase [Polyangiaceae bacterium]|nr:phosphatidate cytidylyltransferase [Polyangiaceae bacterium]
MSEPTEAPAPPAKAPSNLVVRLATAFTLGPLLLVLLFWGPVWAWAAFLVLAATLASRELLGMTHPADPGSRWLGSIVSGALAWCAYSWREDPRLFFSAVVVVVIFSALVPLVRLGEIPTAALRVLGGISAPFYVGVLLMTLAMLRRDQGATGPAYVFLTLTLAWMGDTGGYVLGRAIGKTQLYPAVSPKKTREGLLGSVLFATGAGILASCTYLPDLPLGHGALLGVFGALLGQSGDLVESLLKRSTGVKDSGALLPGHGGLLDRIDALLVVGPLVYLYTLWFH